MRIGACSHETKTNKTGGKKCGMLMANFTGPDASFSLFFFDLKGLFSENLIKMTLQESKV